MKSVALSGPPFAIYVVWHPKFDVGSSVAHQLHNHFGANRFHNIVGGAGVTVLFRNTNAPGSNVPLSIDWEDASTTAAVVLMDVELTNDPAWNRYVRGLVETADTRGYGSRVFPIIMEPGALGDGLDLQAIRWDQWPEDQANRERSIILELTHEFCRMLRHQLGSHVGTEADELRRYRQNIQVFLSHSKHDEFGVVIARAIRDWLHNNSSLSSFLDVYDIPPGVSFSSVLDDSMRDGSMVCIYTDSYSSREWCRREVLMAKRRNIPMLLVDCLNEVDELAFPYLGNVPVIRIDPHEADRISRVHSLLLDEIFKDLLWRNKIDGFLKSNSQVIFVARPPELISLLGIRNFGDEEEFSIVFPGPPLGVHETQLFAQIAPNVRLHTLTEWLVKE